MPDQKLPYNYEAERWLLSCVMMDTTLLSECISRQLKETDFYDRTAQLIYKAMLELYYKNMDISPITLQDVLMDMKVIDQIGWIEYLYELNIAELSTNNFLDYLTIVLTRSKQRQFIREVQKILPMAYDTSSDDVMSKLRVATHWLLNGDLSEDRGWKIGVAYDKLVDTLKAWWLQPICNTWFELIDAYTKWFWETSVWVVGARSGMWKSTFVLNMLINACQQWTKCCLFSLEVNAQEISEKIMSNICWIPSQDYNAQEVDESVFQKIDACEDCVKPVKENLYVYDKLRRYQDIVSQIYALSGQWVKIFCIDHLLLVQTDTKRQNKATELWDIVNWLKWIAQELNICIILVSQFNRKIDDRIGWEPQLADFNGASDIENIANVAIWLLRQEYVDKDYAIAEDKNTIDVYILKNRKNPIANFRYRCDMSISKIFDDWVVKRWDSRVTDKSKKDLKSQTNTVKQNVEEFNIEDYEIESEY